MCAVRQNIALHCVLRVERHRRIQSHRLAYARVHVIHPLQFLVRPIIPSTDRPYSIASSRLHYLGDLAAKCFLHMRMTGEQPEEPCQCSRRRVSARQHKT
eukprot:Gb_12226 [translate_table: standard]